jgi:hypothetical protein
MSRQHVTPRVQCEFLRTCSAGAERTNAPRVQVELVRASSAREDRTAPQQLRSSKSDHELLKRAFSHKVHTHTGQRRRLTTKSDALKHRQGRRNLRYGDDISTQPIPIALNTLFIVCNYEINEMKAIHFMIWSRSCAVKNARPSFELRGRPEHKKRQILMNSITRSREP